jgi:16S rRNA (uracil1498-N3)-methyltransferase
MARRLFFVDEIHSGAAEIDGDEALHLTKVLRVEEGQIFEISDNQQLYLARVETARKNKVLFRVQEKLAVRAQAAATMVLFPALIKFDHFEWMLEKATELGVDRVVPVVSERSEHGLDKAAWKRMDRWRRILKESAQQCRRWQLPVLEDPIPMRRVYQVEGTRYLLDEHTSAPPVLAALPAQRSSGDAVKLLIGPEGGWTDSERSLAITSGWRPVSLGRTILRAETAATAALAIVGAWWQASPDTLSRDSQIPHEAASSDPVEASPELAR